MKYIKYTLLLILVICSSACEEVVHVDLDTAPPRLVIDASINWVKGTDGSLQIIKLSKTTGFYETEIPVVSGATVTVANSNNVVFEFVETPGTGEYICTDFIPEIGETYILTLVSEGQIYVATETLIASPTIDSHEQINDGGFTGEETQIKFFFEDDGTVDNFYMTAFETSITVYPDYDVYDDEFFQGNQTFGLYISEDLEPGDQMQFSLFGISERYMNYMNILLTVSDGDGGPWQTSPSNVRGNIINQVDSDEFALGYFRLSEVDTMQYIVE